MSIETHWTARQSAQCLVDLGTTGPGEHSLTLTVCSNRSGLNQVKVYGIYEQVLQSADRQRRSFAALRQYFVPRTG